MSETPSLIAAVADELTITGLRLAGITDVHIIKRVEESRPILQNLAERTDIAVLMLPKDVVNYNKRLISRLLDQAFPIIIELPDENDTDSANETLKALIRKAIGVDLAI